MKIIRTAILLLCFIISAPAGAQQASDSKTITKQRILSEMNRIKPLQNPGYEKSEEIYKYNILDSANKSIGELKDVLVSKNGDVSSVLVSFDKLRLTQSVYLNFDRFDIGGVTTGYRLGFRENEIAGLYPTLLAGIETAGEGDKTALSSILNRPVVTNKGARIGKVTQGLFNKNASRLVALYVEVTYSTLRNDPIAIPLKETNFVKRGSGLDVMVDQSYADLMINYIRER